MALDIQKISGLGIILTLGIVIFSLFSKFIPEVSFLKPSLGLLLGGIFLSVFVGYAIINKSFKIDTKNDMPGLLIVTGIIVLLLLFGFGVIGGDFFKGSITELQSLVGVL